MIILIIDAQGGDAGKQLVAAATGENIVNVGVPEYPVGKFVEAVRAELARIINA